MFGKKFWRYGLGLHLSLVTVIAASAYLGILPTSYKVIPHADLLGHFILIGVIAFFFDGVLNFRPLFPGSYSFLRLAPILVLALAACEEAAQLLSPLRTACISDFIADAAGILLGAWLAKFLTQRYAPDVRNA